MFGSNTWHHQAKETRPTESSVSSGKAVVSIRTVAVALHIGRSVLKRSMAKADTADPKTPPSDLNTARNEPSGGNHLTDLLTYLKQGQCKRPNPSDP